MTNYASWHHTCQIKKTSILILCSFVFSPLRIHSLFSRLKPPQFWPYMVMWREIWISLITCNSTPFYPIEVGFSLLILFLCDKNSCTVLNTAFEIFSVVTKSRCHLRHHTSQKTQKYLYNGKNIKKNFLQLRCSHYWLHLKYKVLLCEPKIKFKKVAGGKALATDHRGYVHLLRAFFASRGFRVTKFSTLRILFGQYSNQPQSSCLLRQVHDYFLYGN